MNARRTAQNAAWDAMERGYALPDHMDYEPDVPATGCPTSAQDEAEFNSLDVGELDLGTFLEVVMRKIEFLKLDSIHTTAAWLRRAHLGKHFGVGRGLHT